MGFGLLWIESLVISLLWVAIPVARVSRARQAWVRRWITAAAFVVLRWLHCFDGFVEIRRRDQ